LLSTATESPGNTAVDTTDPAEASRADRERASTSGKTALIPGNGSDDKSTPEPERSAADILAAADMQNPAVREQVVAQLREKSEQRRADAETRANAQGIPVRMETPEGQVIELQGFKVGSGEHLSYLSLIL